MVRELILHFSILTVLHEDTVMSKKWAMITYTCNLVLVYRYGAIITYAQCLLVVGLVPQAVEVYLVRTDWPVQSNL